MANTASESDAIKYTFALGESLNVLTDATEGAGKSFGDFASSSNKGWTVLARILSGSGLWRLQARLRAAGNIFELYHLNQKKMIEQQLKGVQSNIRVRDSVEEMAEAYNDVSDAVTITLDDINDKTSKYYKKAAMEGKYKDPVLRMVLGDYTQAGFKDALKRATADTLNMYSTVQDGLEKTEKKRAKALDKRVHGRLFSIKRAFHDVTGSKKYHTEDKITPKKKATTADMLNIRKQVTLRRAETKSLEAEAKKVVDEKMMKWSDLIDFNPIAEMIGSELVSGPIKEVLTKTSESLLDLSDTAKKVDEMNVKGFSTIQKVKSMFSRPSATQKANIEWKGDIDPEDPYYEEKDKSKGYEARLADGAKGIAKTEEQVEQESSFADFMNALDEFEAEIIEAGIFKWSKVVTKEFSESFKKIPILGKAGTALWKLADFGFKNRKLYKESEESQIAGWKNAINENERVKKIKDWMSGKSKGDIFKAIGSAMIKFMIWMIVISTGVFLLIMIGRKAWPHVVKTLRKYSDVFMALWDSIKGFLMGILHLVEALIAGDFYKFMSVLFNEVILNMVKMLFLGITAVGIILYAIGKALIIGLAEAVYAMAESIKKGIKEWSNPFDGKATGGSASGWTLVGEKGPELINAGRASHVYSNQQSKQMVGGNTNNFTIQVQGSMGSSDEEIRRLADKLGREINMRVNRSSSSSMGYSI